ncbi:hypothetical protein F8S09_14850 [Deinococcus sp. SDU3-2]|uniref:Uncharacterized protein n=1 Tax=Deinococcus terrestris TaxID=2651870 RepID=A0A7X1NY99_9DEIO|nr:DUF5819 family protein [Deinococcus terrestris]MPY67938.1 hypothetical protein [Deinococcus terrestris]
MLKKALYFMALLIFTGYFAATALFVSPANPIKTQTNVHNQIIGKYFYQDWGLFAPNPISSSVEVHLQCLSNTKVTHLINVSKGIWQRHQKNRVSPYDRIGRVLGNYGHSIISVSRQEVLASQECSNDPGSGACKRSKRLRKSAVDFATRGLTRVASGFCGDQAIATGHTFDRAQIYLSLTPVNRWSKRHDPPREAEFIDVGEHPLVAVAAPGIWR